MSSKIGATEELIRASSILVESTAGTMEELKNVLTSFSDIVQRLSDLQEKFDSKINTLNQRLLNLESNLLASVKAEDQSDVQLTKNQSIDWALEHAHCNQFSFIGSGSITRSEPFVKEVLLFFRRGFGRYISNSYFINDSTYHVSTPSDNQKQAFRDALSKQLHELLGQKPRLVLEDGDNQYCIYYS